MAPDPAEQESPEARLDLEIADIKAQISSLAHRRAILTTNLLSSTSTHSLLKRVKFAPLPTSDLPPTSSIIPDDNSPLLPESIKHSHHAQECLYRMCAGATMFAVQDPDPNSVDQGRIIGVRIEVFSGDKFLPPYYLVLNRPYSNSPFLRLHRHTIPPFIDLPALRTKYLPAPTSTSSLKSRKQNLPRLVRELRRELVSYHLRLASIESLRSAVGLDPSGKRGRSGIKDISLADVEGRNIRICWRNGDLGHVKVGTIGTIEKCVVVGENGRERAVERRLLGGYGHVSGLAERVLEL